ncbi:glycosyltransferase [Phycicoccus sp. 3266]|uniref:glycosyltransferase n=1 Tax=Phycicoccus sp. 3266 TaxID=2817751 RepID=UPI002863299D|nr:glycosyltransferase [Phycicoccus sp. 3266]MDR6862246.1 GT2 family glycosyltransferase [Phycicoccus sp. 3266]
MTLAPPQHGLTDPPGGSLADAVVTAVLVLRGPASALDQTLDSLARQTRRPDRLVVVDAGLDGNAVEQVRAHDGVASAVPDILYVTIPRLRSVSAAVRTALAETSHRPLTAGTANGSDDVVRHVWVLTSDSVAAPMALARLLDAVRRSPSVGVAGPKLLDWERPGALHSVGVQLTRSGRVIPAPAPGEPDQGQYDRRTDVLAVPSTGMLVEQDLFEHLGGPDRALGDFGGDVDLAWRAHQSGRRVVVVPRATVRTGAPVLEGDAAPPPDLPSRRRREARRVALARCATWAVPFLAAWVVLTSLAAAAALLLAKRPRAAWTELSDVGAVLTPGRVLGARWRSRGTRRVRRRDLHGLFVPPRTVLRHTTDLIHDQVGVDDTDDPRVDGAESGPVADEAQDLHVLGSTWASRAARNPGLLAVVLMAVVAVVGTRHLGGSWVDRLGSGMSGGELLGVRATSSSLLHAWLDGWHGAGLGGSGEVGPHLVVLAGLAWVVSHVPFLSAPDSPAGAAVALLVTLALPLATTVAYLAGRVVTHSRWPRALAALVWSTTSVLTSAVAGGRLGGVVAAVLLPLVAAGVVLAARRSGTATATAATVLAAAALGSFAPALLVPVLVAGLVLLVAGPGGRRWRGLALLGGPLALLGPFVGAVLDRPALIVTGPGLAVWGTAQAAPWQLALLHPGGPGSFPVLLSAPVVAAGLLAQLRAGRRGAAAGAVALLGLAGLSYAVVAPRLVVGTVPDGLPHAGQPVTVWAGTGLLLWALGLVAAALLGADGLPVSRARGGWLALLRWPVGVALVAGVLLSAGWTTWRTVGSTLGAWSDPRPAVAVDQAESGISNRMVLIAPAGDGLSYRLVGREPGDVARSLPVPTERPDTRALSIAVTTLFQEGDAPTTSPTATLSDLAVGFVGLQADSDDPRVRALDATAGLSRLGEHDGTIFWRVLPGGGSAADDSLAPARARLVTKSSEQVVPTAGDHARLDAQVVAPQGTTLVLAEPQAWTRHARVTSDGQVLAPVGDAAAYKVPAGSHRLEVTVLPSDTYWRYLQGLALLVAAFLAIPFGNRASRRRR